MEHSEFAQLIAEYDLNMALTQTPGDLAFNTPPPSPTPETSSQLNTPVKTIDPTPGEILRKARQQERETEAKEDLKHKLGLRITRIIRHTNRKGTVKFEILRENGYKKLIEYKEAMKEAEPQLINYIGTLSKRARKEIEKKTGANFNIVQI